MKKLICLATIPLVLSCGSNNTDANKSESSPVTPPVENVEGSLPDSTNSINLNQPLPVDSSRVNDSVPR